ncbi:Wadjet anti-phage system protein JetD domain-containing protein [Victivallis vadensis]|uniref:Wadjet anti-phage system protein JetD domain-containing protein n=1 Tax=Victivallis vadensis TaxID=172901 RepID=UPI00307D1B06
MLERLRYDPATKTLTLPPGDRLLYGELFLNCVVMRGGKPVLNCGKLRSQLGNDWENWLYALRQSSGFQVLSADRSRDAFFHRISFQIPAVDWTEFRSELRSDLDIDVLKDAFHAAEYLSDCPNAITPAELGARLFRDSKRLKTTSVLTWLCRFLRQKNGIDSTCSDGELLEKFGLSGNPTASTVLLYGPFRYEDGGETMSWIETLWTKGQSAMLSCDNLNTLERVFTDRPVLTIENESVFNRMKNLGKEYALVYTAGFPGRAVRRLLAALPQETPLFHWGDGDPEGYEIAAILNRIHPLHLFRCDAENLEQLKVFSSPLPDTKRKRAERLWQTPDFPFHNEIQWILKNNRWLEQESFFSRK